MSLNGPHLFTENLRDATLAEPSIAQNEVEARHREVASFGKGGGGWKDRIAVFVGVGLLALFAGAALWNLYGP